MALRAAPVAAAAAAAIVYGCVPAPSPDTLRLEPQLAAIEAKSGGRLGVALADTSGRLVTGHKASSTFAFCSTFKLLLAGMILDGARRGHWSLDERLPLSSEDIVFHSPISSTRVDDGWISLGEAARAIVTVSDNAAANLLVRRIGGRSVFNQWLRTLGDHSTRLDRPETELNSNHPGDPRDSTTPQAMAQSTARLVFGSALQDADRRTLRGWLVDSETGRDRIRAGLPEGFIAGDKTGTCGAKGRESYNDVAFVLPDPAMTDRGYVLAVYLDRPAVDSDRANALLAQVAAATAPLMRN